VTVKQDLKLNDINYVSLYLWSIFWNQLFPLYIYQIIALQTEVSSLWSFVSRISYSERSETPGQRLWPVNKIHWPVQPWWELAARLWESSYLYPWKWEGSSPRDRDELIQCNRTLVSAGQSDDGSEDYWPVGCGQITRRCVCITLVASGWSVWGSTLEC